MRVHKSYEKAGFFWLPESPENKIPGTLKICDGGNIELEIMGLFEQKGETSNETNEIERIVGQVEKDGFVTLETCVYRKIGFPAGGIFKSLVHVNRAFCGVAYEKDELIKFNSVSFSIEGLDKWLGKTGISVAYDKDGKLSTITCTPHRELVYDLISGLKLHICFDYIATTVPLLTEAKFTQQAYLKLSIAEEQSLDTFIEVLHKLTYLLCFATDATVAIFDVSAQSNSLVRKMQNGKTRPVIIKLYYSSLPFSQDPPEIELYRMLFSFNNIENDAENILRNWLNAYSIIRPSLNLYFSAVTGSHKYLDGRFLALAQAMETYHRRTSCETLMDEAQFRQTCARLLWDCPKHHRTWLRGRLMHGNEINLGKRVKKIIEPFSTKIGNRRARSKLIRNIVDTRNYLTHYTEALEKKSVSNTELWYVCQKMEAIFQLLLLKQLGFEELEIENILNSSYRLKQKITET